jgi:predicted TIM-barrel fold metal-dependent hydrolase
MLTRRDVWGTDWPHTNSGLGKPLSEIAPPQPIDDARPLDQVPKWAPDPAIRKMILADNPARLYGFSG